MKIVIIYSKTKLSGILTKFWTGEYAYHIGFLDEVSDTFYDMNILPRKVYWTDKNYKDFTLHPCDLTATDCENYLKIDSLHIRYGMLDYCLFALRPLLHLFGKSTINANGVICSEMVNNWLWRNQDNATPFHPADAPPSPADFVRLYQ